MEDCSFWGEPIWPTGWLQSLSVANIQKQQSRFYIHHWLDVVSVKLAGWPLSDLHLELKSPHLSSSLLRRLMGQISLCTSLMITFFRPSSPSIYPAPSFSIYPSIHSSDWRDVMCWIKGCCQQSEACVISTTPVQYPLSAGLALSSPQYSSHMCKSPKSPLYSCFTGPSTISTTTVTLFTKNTDSEICGVVCGCLMFYRTRTPPVSVWWWLMQICRHFYIHVETETWRGQCLSACKHLAVDRWHRQFSNYSMEMWAVQW